MSNIKKKDKSSERYNLDDFSIKQSKDAEGNAIDGKYDLTMKYGDQEVTKQIGDDDLNRLVSAGEGDKVNILGSLATGNPNMFTNQNHDEIAGKVVGDVYKMIGNYPEGVGFHKVDTQERYLLDDFSIKQSKDAEGNAIDGKYDLTMKYGGQEVTRQIGDDDLNRLVSAGEGDKVHILGSLATGNPNMFTNQNHDEIAGKVAGDYLYIIVDEQDKLERSSFKEMPILDSSDKKVEEKAKDVVTGQNLDSLKMGAQPVVNGRKFDDSYVITIQYDGDAKRSRLIDQKTFDKLQLVNDYQRTKMLGNLFPEVDFRFSSEEQKNVGQMIADETRSAGNDMEQEKNKALEQVKQRNQAIGMAASSLFESMSQEDDQSQSVNRGLGL